MRERQSMQSPPREIHFDGVHCNLTAQEFPPKVVVLRISGSDIGEFGEAPMRTLDDWLSGGGRVHFFIDAYDVRGVSMDVSGEWAQWLSAHKDHFKSVTMLTGSHFIHVTADFVRRFAALEGIMRICTERAVFDRALADAVPSEG
jgi:hypothetical protein